MSLDPTFVYGNCIEAGLWATMSVIAVAKRYSRWSVALALALLAFGASYVDEVRP